MAGHPLIIRPAEPGDAPTLLELFFQHAAYEKAAPPTISPSQLCYLIADKIQIDLWVASFGDSMVGYFSLTQDYATWTGEKYLHIDCLFLHQDYRQLGIGTQLFTKIKHIAQSLGLKQIQWQSPIENKTGSAFYQRQGASFNVKSRFSLVL